MTSILRIKTNQNTRELAAHVFALLNIADFKEKDSENYPPEGIYFLGKKDGLEIKVCASEEEEHDFNFRHWVIVDAPDSEKILNIIKALVKAGYEVAENFAQADNSTVRKTYSLDAEGKLTEQTQNLP
jgi:hypothetical protein